MRVWERVKIWADEEAQSAHSYSRLAETAVLHGERKAGLWNDPDLQVALDWQQKNQPNKDWARRYDPGFEKAIAFLQASEKKRADDEAERQHQQNAEVERARRELQQAQALVEAQQQRAEAERQKAEEQRQRLEQQARATSRMRRLLAAFAVVALLALASTVFSFSAYKKADAATKNAVKEKDKAVAAEIVAKGEREKADAASQKAAEEDSKAVKEKDRAETQSKLAEAQTLLAQDSAKKAERERKNAEGERKDKQEQATTYGYFKTALDELAAGNHEDAVASLQNALTYFTDKRDKPNILSTRVNIGDVYGEAYRAGLTSDDPELSTGGSNAVENYNMAIALIREGIGDDRLLISTLEKAARIWDESKKSEERQQAAAFYQQAGAVYHKLGLKNDE